MDLPETLEIKSDALKFCGKVLKIINDLSLKVETSFDGDSIIELFEDSKKKIKKLC